MKRWTLIALLPLMWLPSQTHAQVQPQAPARHAALIKDIDARQSRDADVAMQIWRFAELGYLEEKSSALLQSELTAAGFTLDKGVAGMPTAFVASYGSGAPVVAILGEFDALPGLSQDAVPERKPIVDGAPGHACGHHLFGTASAAAAIAVKNWLAASKQSGTIRFYGTPAEEGGSAKVYMVRDGLFKDVDVVIAWHPGDRNFAGTSSSLANIGVKFRFKGVPSHAASAPEKGRSALDGVEAMNHMVNMMREHVPQETRMHYVITKGGAAPNVVPGDAETYYYVRHPDVRTVRDIFQRIVNASKGAALGTDTTVEHEIIGGVYNLLPNDTLAAVQARNLAAVGGVTYTPEEQTFAERIQNTLAGGATLALGSQETVYKPTAETSGGGASTDVGDVSWAVPTVQVVTATWVPGTPAHSWQAVAAGGMSIGVKGMMVAARTMALTASDVFSDPALIQKAKAEFDQRRAGQTYAALVGARKPALDYRK